MLIEMLSGGGGGAVGDYTKFKQGTFTTTNDTSNPTVVNDIGFTPKFIICIPRTSQSSSKYSIYFFPEIQLHMPKRLKITTKKK